MTGVWPVNCSRILEVRVGLSPDSPTDMSVVTARIRVGQGEIAGRLMAAHTDDRLFGTEISLIAFEHLVSDWSESLRRERDISGIDVTQ